MRLVEEAYASGASGGGLGGGNIPCLIIPGLIPCLIFILFWFIMGSHIIFRITIQLYPSISRLLVTAFAGTALAFACFSLAALMAKRRQFLYLGGVLGSAISMLFWLRFASNLFGGSVALFNVEIYFGLLVFVVYIVFDTQSIVEMACAGDRDYIKHALELFTDFVAVFVRILIIMLKNSSEGKKEKKRRS